MPKIQNILDISAKANRNVFVKVLKTDFATSQKGENNLFDIKKTALENPIKNDRELLGKDSKDLMPFLKKEHRGRKYPTLLMEMNNTKAIATTA
jgi:hypothetical protein